MTLQEFSTEFDTLYNNITSNQAPGLDEYEKSVFLTKAQNQLVTEFFNNRTDGVGGGYDGSQKRQYDFSSLVVTERLHMVLSTYTGAPPLDSRSMSFMYPEDYFLTVNETVKINKTDYAGNGIYSVFPLTYGEYQRLMLKPYQWPVKRAIWRIFTGTVSGNETTAAPGQESLTASDIGIRAELVGKYLDGLLPSEISYVLRYVKTLLPIILEPLGALTISGYDGANASGTPVTTGATQGIECKLPEECHQEILERAVTLAKLAWQGQTATTNAIQSATQRNKDN